MLLSLQNKLGAFAYAATLPSAIDNETLVETDVFDLKFRNKGGYLSEVKLKDDKGAFFTDFRGENVFIINKIFREEIIIVIDKIKSCLLPEIT